MSISQVIQITGGATPPKETCILVNRTGGALVEGDMVALNLAFAATAGQAMVGLDPSVDADGATGYVYGAAISPTTEANTRRMAVAMESIADNATGRFLLKGIGKVNMNGANAGEFIIGTNGQKYATPYTLTELESLATIAGVVGIALEATTGAQVKLADFDGSAFKSLAGNIS